MSALETALNQYLALAINRDELLNGLDGKTIAVTVQPFNETLYLCPTHDAIQLLSDTLKPADTHLTGSLFAFGMMGLSTQPMRSIFSGAVTIEGDMRTGRKLQELLAKLELDIEPKLAQLTGVAAAKRLVSLFNDSRAWGEDTVESLRLNLSEFLQEETRQFPAAGEIAIFYRQVDTLRSDYDRLQSRIERLETTFPNTQNSATKLSTQNIKDKDSL